MLDFDNFSTRDGVSAGKAVENRMIGSVGGPDTIRTKLLKTSDGEVMLRTRNGFPEFTLKKEDTQASALRLWHGLFTTKDELLENVDQGDGYIKVFSNKGDLLLRDWGDKTDGTLMDAVIDGHGSTYYSSFPLVSTAKMPRITETARYSIAAAPGGNYTIDSDTLVSATDKSDRTTTVTKTNNVDFKAYERGGSAGWWPWLDVTDGTVYWFSAFVAGNPTLQKYTITIKRSNDKGGSDEVGQYDLSYTDVYGGEREQWAERFTYNGLPQHSPTGAIALLHFYINEDELGGDTRSTVTNNILGAVVRVTITSKTTATVASELTAWEVFPPAKIINAVAPQGCVAGYVGAGKSVWHNSALNACQIVQYRKTIFEPNGTDVVSFVEYYKSTASLISMIWDEWDVLPGWEIHTEQTHFALGMFFTDSEVPITATVDGHYEIADTYVNEVTHQAASGTGSKEIEFTYVADPYFNDRTIPEHNTFSGGGAEVWTLGFKQRVSRTVTVSVGATSFSIKGPVTGYDDIEVTNKPLTYTWTGYAGLSYDSGDDLDNYYVDASGVVDRNTMGTTGKGSYNHTNTPIDEPGRSLLWIELITNNVVRVSDWEYDKPATEAKHLLTANGAYPTSGSLPCVSWNPRTGELANSDKRVQWV